MCCCCCCFALLAGPADSLIDPIHHHPPKPNNQQVAYLVRKGYGDGVVTEDSDLITVRKPTLIVTTSTLNSTPYLSPSFHRHNKQYAALASRPFPILFKLDATGACVELTYDPAELSMRAGGSTKIDRQTNVLGEGRWIQTCTIKNVLIQSTTTIPHPQNTQATWAP